MPDLREFTATVSPAWSALATSCRGPVNSFQEQFSAMVFLGGASNTYEVVVVNSRAQEFLAVFFPFVDLAVHKRRLMGPQVHLPVRVSPDLLSPDQEAGLNSLISSFRNELVPAADAGCVKTASLIESEGAKKFGAAVARRCLSDLPAEAHGWVQDIGLVELLRLLCLSGFVPSDEDLSNGMASLWVNNESGGYGEYAKLLTFSRQSLREDQISTAWVDYAVNRLGILRSTWKYVAEYYRERKQMRHARSVLEAISEGWCLQALSHDTIVGQVEEVVGQSEGSVAAALLALSEIALADQRYEDAYFFSRRLFQHLSSGPGSSEMDLAEIEMRVMQCRGRLGWQSSSEDVDRVNRLLRENMELRASKEDLSKKMASSEFLRDVLGQMRGGVVKHLRAHFRDSWDKLAHDTRGQLATAKSLLTVYDEGKDSGFDLRSSIVMPTAWAVELQLQTTLFPPLIRRELGWTGQKKPTLTDMIGWISGRQFGIEANRVVREPERLCEPTLRKCLANLRNDRDGAAHAWPQEYFEVFRSQVFESDALRTIFSILTDRKAPSGSQGVS